MKNKIKEILERETQGLNLNEKAKEFFRIFSYKDVERLMEELIEENKGVKYEKTKSN